MTTFVAEIGAALALTVMHSCVSAMRVAALCWACFSNIAAVPRRLVTCWRL